jgi:energy-coupling factor transporter transmembrane protein EcfT
VQWGVGVTARAGALVLAVVLAAATSGVRLGAALALTWLLAVCVHPAAFRVLGRAAVWALLLLLAAPPLIVTTPRDVALPMGAAVSAEAIALALTMTARTLIIVVAAAGFAATVSVRALTELLEVVGLRGLGFSLGVAVHALPLARRTWTTSARALRLRGGFRRSRLRDAALLCMTVVGNALRHADEVVEAALARGFAPGRRRREPPARWRSDLGWMAIWTAIAALVMVV